jgi:hypothetical protein
MRLLIYILVLNSFTSLAQDKNKSLYFYFDFNKSNSLIKEWYCDDKKEIFKISNSNNDIFEFVCKNYFVLEDISSIDVIFFDKDFNFDLVNFLKIIENKELYLIVKFDNVFRSYKVNETKTIERHQE